MMRESKLHNDDIVTAIQRIRGKLDLYLDLRVIFSGMPSPKRNKNVLPELRHAIRTHEEISWITSRYKNAVTFQSLASPPFPVCF